MYQMVGFRAIQLMRWSFDRATGYSEHMSEAKWLQRIIFLETVAGVPGMVAGMIRHLKSLRTMRRDHGACVRACEDDGGAATFVWPRKEAAGRTTFLGLGFGDGC